MLAGRLAGAALSVTCATCVMCAAAHAQVAVIVNASSPIASLTADQAAALFLGKSTTLPNGGIPLLADQPDTSAAHELFYARAAGKTAAQVHATWARLTSSGRATPPKELPNSAEVKKYVAAHADAIGYVEKAAADGSVKVVLTLD